MAAVWSVDLLFLNGYSYCSQAVYSVCVLSGTAANDAAYLGISISMTDGLPQQICQRCAPYIQAAAEFRVKAHDS